MQKSIQEIITCISNRIFGYKCENNHKHILNINYTCNHHQPNVLICYLATGYFRDISKNQQRTIHTEIFKIVRIFLEYNFSIDIIYCNDLITLNKLIHKDYAIIFGFGEAFYQATQKLPETLSILYMTEHHPRFSLEEETKRIDYYFKRHKKKMPLQRSGHFYTLKHFEKQYTHLIALGQIEPFLSQYTKPYSIFPTGLINDDFIFKIKNHDLGRKQYLWFGSSGAIHKGLDLLLDIFSVRNDITLHICGMSPKDKEKLRVPKKSNIIDHGFVNVSSAKFLEIIEEVTFLILPSCSEGFSTSITTGMLHGLIPIVMKGTGFDRLNENAFFLTDFHVEEIDRLLTDLSNQDCSVLQEKSRRIFEFAMKNFTKEAFEASFRIIICDILSQHINLKNIIKESNSNERLMASSI